jgi:hypothetical protein
MKKQVVSNHVSKSKKRGKHSKSAMSNKEKFLQLVTGADTTLISEIEERIRNRENELQEALRKSG